jgi:hypothetical protein
VLSTTKAATPGDFFPSFNIPYYFVPGAGWYSSPSPYYNPFGPRPIRFQPTPLHSYPPVYDQSTYQAYTATMPKGLATLPHAGSQPSQYSLAESLRGRRRVRFDGLSSHLPKRFPPSDPPTGPAKLSRLRVRQRVEQFHGNSTSPHESATHGGIKLSECRLPASNR